MSAYKVGDKFIIEIVDVIHRKSERYGDETVLYVVDQIDNYDFEDIDLDRLELYDTADTPQTARKVTELQRMCGIKIDPDQMNIDCGWK